MVPRGWTPPTDATGARAHPPIRVTVGGRSFWTRGHLAVKFVEASCCFTDGEWIGRPFRLLPWQREWLLELLEVEHKGGRWRRRYRTALLGVPKKNGKTELIAALGLYLLLADGEPSPLIICAASSEEQADLIFKAARTMCELSPVLQRVAQVWTDEITVPSSPGARLVRVAAAAGKLDGKNVHAVLIDELHEWNDSRSEQSWHILTNGTGARSEPLVVQITTAGHDLQSLCGQQYEYGKQVAAGEIADAASHTYFFRWWEAPDGSDHRDPAVWRAANPSFGLVQQEDCYTERLARISEAIFRRYFLNQWTEAEELWLPASAWDGCAVPAIAFEPRRGPRDSRPMWVAVDAATKHDTTAIVWAQWLELAGRPRLALGCRVWARPFNPLTRKPVEGWVLPIGEVKDFLRRLHREYAVEQIGYDPAYLTWAAQELAAEGLPMLEFSQSPQRMVPACQAFYEHTVQTVLAHDGDAVLARHIRAAVAVPAQGGDGGWRLTKGRAKRPMDAAIAAAMAVSLAQAPPEPDPGPQIWIGDDDDDE